MVAHGALMSAHAVMNNSVSASKHNWGSLFTPSYYHCASFYYHRVGPLVTAGLWIVQVNRPRSTAGWPGIIGVRHLVGRVLRCYWPNEVMEKLTCEVMCVSLSLSLSLSGDGSQSHVDTLASTRCWHYTGTCRMQCTYMYMDWKALFVQLCKHAQQCTT